jgi:putative peptidoglycan lipid II flippase
MFSFFRRFWNGETESVTTAALIVGAASLISRLVGVFRDRILASTFGAADTLDAYYAAFKIPDFLYNLVILGALSAAFIPVFTEYLESRQKNEAWRLAERMLSVVSAVMLAACAALFFLAPVLVPLTVPGFEGEKLAFTITLSRIMLVSTFFLALSGVMGGILQATRRFVAFSLAPVFYNLGIIAGVVFFVPNIGPAGLGWGVALGAFVHLAIQASVALKLGLERIPFPSFRHQGVRRILRLMAPRTMGLAVMQVNLVVLLAIASTLAVGSVAVFNLAMNLQSVPVGIFGISFAVAAFPALSRAAASKNAEKFRGAFGAAARKIVFLVLPATALMLLLRAQIVRLILGQGKFDWDDTVRTANVLAIFAISLVAQALVPLLARSFYALQNTWTPLWIGAIAEGTNIVLALLLVGPYGLNGLVFAFTIAAWLSLILFWWRLRASQGRLGTAEVWDSFKRIAAACFIMAGVALSVRIAIGTIYPLRTFWQVALQAGASAAAGLLAFWIICRLLKSKELDEFQRAFVRRFWKRGMVLEGAEEAQGR